MVELTFVRHGQAQTGARDEISYDSSVHRSVKMGDVLALKTFNGLSHLERPDRAHARAYT